MNIEELISHTNIIIEEGLDSEDDIQLLLQKWKTAYEKEKGENVKLRLQDIPLIEGELKAYKDRVNELKAELEKEKEKNKEHKQRITYLENKIFNQKQTIKEGGIKQC